MTDAELRDLARRSGDGDLDAAEAVASELRRRNGRPGPDEALGLLARRLAEIADGIEKRGESGFDPRPNSTAAMIRDAISDVVPDRTRSFYERHEKESRRRNLAEIEESKRMHEHEVEHLRQAHRAELDRVRRRERMLRSQRR